MKRGEKRTRTKRQPALSRVQPASPDLAVGASNPGPVAAVPVPTTMPASTPMHGIPVTSGSMAAADWLRARGLRAHASSWFVDVVLDTVDRPAETLWTVSDSRFHLYIFPTEWSFFFCHGGRASWIRIADRPIVHARDDFGLVTQVPRLADVGGFLLALEERNHILFRRELALVRTNLENAEAPIKYWLSDL